MSERLSNICSLSPGARFWRSIYYFGPTRAKLRSQPWGAPPRGGASRLIRPRRARRGRSVRRSGRPGPPRARAGPLWGTGGAADRRAAEPPRPTHGRRTPSDLAGPYPTRAATAGAAARPWAAGAHCTGSPGARFWRSMYYFGPTRAQLRSQPWSTPPRGGASRVIRPRRARRGRSVRRSGRSSPIFYRCGRVRETAAFLTTLDFYDDPRGLGHVQLTFYALKPTGNMNCEPRELTRPRRGRSGPICAQNFEIAAVVA